jgi:hypothetical protein
MPTRKPRCQLCKKPAEYDPVSRLWQCTRKECIQAVEEDIAREFAEAGLPVPGEPLGGVPVDYGDPKNPPSNWDTPGVVSVSLARFEGEAARNIAEGLAPIDFIFPPGDPGIRWRHGEAMPISAKWILVVEGEKPSLCPNRGTPLAEGYLPLLEERYKALGLLPDGKTIHWIGDQKTPGPFCDCYMAKPSEQAEPVEETELVRHPTILALGGWDLSEAGKASYKGGKPFPLKGTNRKLLARLISAKGRAVHERRLKEACGNEDMEDGTLRGYLSRLRQHLSSNLPENQLPQDPLPRQDPDSYKLDLL